MPLQETQYNVLFWIFTGFFSVIGIIALLAILGVIKVDRQFLKWAIGGFVTGVAGVVFMWSRSPALPSLDFYVNLPPPAAVSAETWRLAQGTYEYFMDQSTDVSKGKLELTTGFDGQPEPGWWRARFPSCKDPNRAVTLTLTDDKGNQWVVSPFYPNQKTIEQSTLYQVAQKQAASPPRGAFSVRAALAAEPRIKFGFTVINAQRTGDKTYNRWRLFVDESDPVLGRIKEIRYLFPPGFPEPRQVRTDPGNKFAVETTAIGKAFSIGITVIFKDLTYQNQTFPVRIP